MIGRKPQSDGFSDKHGKKFSCRPGGGYNARRHKT